MEVGERNAPKYAESCQNKFVRAEMIEQTTHYQSTKPVLANVTLCINDIELTIPQGTPTDLAELVGALQS